MSSNIQPLPIYKQAEYYTGFITLILIILVIYNEVNQIFSQSFLNYTVPIIILLGGLTVALWKFKCEKCKRPFCKKEVVEWREDLGIKKEPYTYYSKVLVYDDGFEENDPNSEKTILRERQHTKHYFKCHTCGHGSNKEWTENSSKWLGEEPKPKRVRVKGEEANEEARKRKSIPKSLKEKVFEKYNGKNYGGKCYTCGKKITNTSFEVGHVNPVSKGGSDNISNLRPICSTCNRSMGNEDLYVFKRRFEEK